MPDSLTIPAHAKINLALSVGPPTPPKGYHPIASWFVAIGLHDTVRITRLPTGAQSTYDIRWATGADGTPAPRPTPIDWPIDKDLAVRAHRLMEEHAVPKIPVSLPIHLELIKRTPVGGGLGGGSSDAASTLLGLNRLFNLNLSHTKLAELSTALGSDIAFFIDDRQTAPSDPRSTDDPPPPASPRPALVTGFGGQITRITSPAQTDLLLLLPPFGCPTGPVYQAFDKLPPHPVDNNRVSTLISQSPPPRPLDPGTLFNDLAEPACMVEPRLRSVLDRLQKLSPHRVHVTGSGSTMFVIPDARSPISLAELAARAEALVPELVIVPTTTL